MDCDSDNDVEAYSDAACVSCHVDTITEVDLNNITDADSESDLDARCESFPIDIDSESASEVDTDADSDARCVSFPVYFDLDADLDDASEADTDVHAGCKSLPTDTETKTNTDAGLGDAHVFPSLVLTQTMDQMLALMLASPVCLCLSAQMLTQILMMLLLMFVG